MAIKITTFRPLVKNSLRGFATIRMTNIGLEIRDIGLHEKNSKRWLAMPAKPYEKDGKPAYAHILDFYDKGRADQFQEAALAALDDFLKKNGRGASEF